MKTATGLGTMSAFAGRTLDRIERDLVEPTLERVAKEALREVRARIGDDDELGRSLALRRSAGRFELVADADAAFAREFGTTGRDADPVFFTLARDIAARAGGRTRAFPAAPPQSWPFK